MRAESQPWKLLCLLTMVLAWGGCAGQENKRAVESSFIRTRHYTPRPKAHGNQVRAFVATRPTGGYSEVGVITVRDHNYPRVLWFARAKAAQAGCDAIVQLSTGRVVDGVSTGGLDYHTVGRFSCLIRTRR